MFISVRISQYTHHYNEAHGSLVPLENPLLPVPQAIFCQLLAQPFLEGKKNQVIIQSTNNYEPPITN